MPRYTCRPTIWGVGDDLDRAILDLTLPITGVPTTIRDQDSVHIPQMGDPGVGDWLFAPKHRSAGDLRWEEKGNRDQCHWSHDW
jgi:hypothetical protein